MTLVANRVETRRNTDFPFPPELGSVPSCISVTTERFEDTRLRESFLIKQTVWILDQDGREVWREISEWVYDGIISSKQIPVRFSKETWAWAWLPKVNERAELIKVAEEKTKWSLATIWVDGPRNIETVRSGYVIYDILPSTYTPAQVNAAAAAKGKAPAQAPSDRIPETGRPYVAAQKTSAIVEKPSAAQRAEWKTIEVEQTVVDEDWLRKVTTVFRYDCLNGSLQVEGPTEERKDVQIEMPIPLVAPSLAGGPAGAVAVLEISGGDVKYTEGWPTAHEVVLRPKSYALYRRVISRPARTPATDPFGLYGTDPATPPGPVFKLDDTAVTDLGGTPVSPLPPPVSYSEAEDNSPPVAETWTLVSEAKNPHELEEDPKVVSRLQVRDTDQEAGAVYEYKALARIGDGDSPESNKVRVTATEGTYNSFIGVTVRKGPGGEMVIEARVPGSEGYGETVILKMPVAFEEPDPLAEGLPIETSGLEGWPPGVLATPEDLGAAVGLRQALRDQDKDSLRVTPNAPILVLERGMLARVAPLAWTTYGNTLKISSQTVDALWTVEGFGWTAARDAEGRWSLSVDPVELEEV